MNTDNLNFRGKFRQYDVDGKPYLYKIGDVVDYKGKQYVAVRPTATTVPTTPNGENYWKILAAGTGSFYIQDDPPASGTYIAGDRWYRPTTSVMYTCILQETDLIWVEL